MTSSATRTAATTTAATTTAGTTIAAAVCRAFGAPLRIEQLRLAAPGPGEVMVRMSATAMCHSDITYAEGGWGGVLPAVYGHEGAGIVSEVGRDVVGLVAGDHVVVTLIRSCGHCHGCRSGRPVICETRTALDERSPLTDADGVSVVHGMRTGAFGDHVVVDASQLVKIPDDIAFDVAALLGCGVITGFGAVTNTAQVAAGSNVVVIGCGGVGLNSLQGANVSEAATVIAVDVAESKLAIAPRFGATHTIHSGQVDAVEAVREVTAGRGADYVFVTVGAKSAYDQSYAMLARGGAVVVVGLPYAGVFSEIDPGAMADHSHRIIGSKMGSARITVDIPYLIGLYRQGRLKLDELISGRYPLDRINDAIASVKSGEALRNVIVFG